MDIMVNRQSPDTWASFFRQQRQSTIDLFHNLDSKEVQLPEVDRGKTIRSEASSAARINSCVFLLTCQEYGSSEKSGTR